MIFDSATVENDPFLISMREELNQLEAEKDFTYRNAETYPGNVKARIAYDAALMRWVHKKVAYEAALKAVIGL
jgi:hypothetical protein